MWTKEQYKHKHKHKVMSWWTSVTRLEAQAKRAVGRQVGGFAKPDWARGSVQFRLQKASLEGKGPKGLEAKPKPKP